MTSVFDRDDIQFQVVVNHEEQYSIWPEYKEIPQGWRAAGKSGLKKDCLAYIRGSLDRHAPAEPAPAHGQGGRLSGRYARTAVLPAVFRRQRHDLQPLAARAAWPAWLAVRPVELPGRGARMAEPLQTDLASLAQQLARELHDEVRQGLRDARAQPRRLARLRGAVCLARAGLPDAAGVLRLRHRGAVATRRV